MELTSTPLLVTLISVTVLAVLAALLLWNRIPGPGWVRWPSRVVMLALCQITAIAATAAWINGSYGLYTSWDDLLGTGSARDASVLTGPAPGRATFTRAADGTRSTWFRGSRSKLAGQVIVWTPPEYAAPGAKRTRFPVVVLHGSPGSPRTWLDLGDMPGAAEELIRLGAAHPFILVIPEISPGGVNTDCSNVPGRQVADWLAADVPEVVARNFRTLRGPGGWGLLGVSTGGFCAAKLPLQYPKAFRAGAALDPDPLSGDPEVLPDPVLRERNSPQSLVRQAKGADVGLFLATSAQDRSSPPGQLEAFRRAAAGSGVRVKTLVRPAGGHNFQAWSGMYADALGWLSTELSPPTAGH
ncbi:alpha/beta hydrolase [Streptomyces sp. NPDC127106]|uniref:alpha/beta hydrolase n=1 Tax=Streptomyces sp. NPDC127106 TaxID=3345360 RepID=UPI00362D63A3